MTLPGNNTQPAAPAALLVAVLLAGCAPRPVAQRGWVLFPDAAESIQRAFQRMAPVLRYESIRIEQDHVEARVCSAADCFDLWLEAPGTCASSGGAFCVQPHNHTLAAGERDAIESALRSETSQVKWRNVAAAKEPVLSTRGAGERLRVLIPVVLGWLAGIVLRRLRRRRLSGRLAFLALLVAPPIAVAIVGRRWHGLSLGDAFIVGGLFAFTIVWTAHEAFSDWRARVLTLGTLTLGLIAIEAGARLLPPPPSFLPDQPEQGLSPLGYQDLVCAMAFDEALPNQAAIATLTRVRPGTAYPPSPDRPAVVHIGDSMVYGEGVTESETFVTRLGTLDPTELHLNGGIPGTAPDEYVAMLRYWTTHRSVRMAVMYLYEANDLDLDTRHSCTGWRPLFSYFEGKPELRPRDRVTTLGQHWLSGPVPQILREAAGWSRAAGHLVALIADFRQSELETDQPLETRLEHLKMLLSGAQADLERRGTRLVIVYLPGNHSLGRSYADARRMLDVVRQVGLPLIDVTPVIDGAPQPAALFGPDHVHFNAEGHRVVAGFLAKKLTDASRPGAPAE